MRLCIAGSRDLLPHVDEIEAEVFKLERNLGRQVVTLINGGARGVDAQALLWLDRYRPTVHLIRHLPDYQKYGKHAPLMRNILMGAESDALLAFWDGKSTGTDHMVNVVGRRMFKLPVFVVRKS